MSAMANTTLIVTTVTKPATNPRDADATLRVNIQDFCEEYYEDILPIIMDKVRRDKRKEVHTRLDFEESSREKRTREGHQRQSVFDRLSETYSPSTTKSRPGRTNSRDHPCGRSHPRRLDTSNEDCPEDRERFRGVGESYDDSYSHSYHDRDRSCHMKTRRDNESPLSSVSKSDSSDGRTRMPNNVKTYDETGDPEDHVKIFQAASQVERWAMPTWCHMFNSTLIGAARVWCDELLPESIDSYKDLKAAFLAYFMQQKKYGKDPVEIHNIKQKDRETIEDFMERFKVETERMKGPLNTMEEMMITTTAFIRGEAVAASKKKEITFPPLTTSSGVEGPLVIEAEMGGHMIHRMYVVGGSSMEILYEYCFNRLRPEVKNQMVPATTSLTGFSGETIWPSLSSYNGIIGRHGIREIQAIPSTTHEMLKFPVDGGIVTIRSTILIPAECTTVITSSAVPKEVGAHPENFKVALHPDFPDQEVKGYSPVRQKKRGQAPERAKAIQAKVQMLVKAGIMREDCYPIPEIDWKVESLCGYPFNCFLDAYKGYHQIQLAEPDEEKTAFRTGQRVYCYTKMPFGLKNAGATFLSKSAEKSLLLFKTLKECIKKSDFHWTAEAEQAFKQLKQHLSELPLLVAPKPKEELIVYLSTTYGAISAVLMTEKGAIQTPVYFINRAFQGPKLNYTLMEKLVLSLVFAAKRLRSVMLGEQNITYRPKTSVKRQVLADFLIEMPDENLPAVPVAETQQEPWTLFIDGSSCVDRSGAGLILTSSKGTEFAYSLRFQFAASNNEAEYEALIDGLRIAAQMGVQNVHVSVDSKLVAIQVLRTYVTKEENMIKYLEKVKSLVSGFTNFSISQVPRSKNKKADALSKIASTSFAHLSKKVLVEILKEKSIKEKEVTFVVEEDGPTWMKPIMEYLKEGTLPSDRKEARKLRIKA
uniref:Reverse transcriptase domain-containing protein n=1 Tax=Tanacetum cinerariifolium TaxID=118510 RepID=A0A699H0X4_TANCI|nr:reverse transcriptase domain-containing protein [Tanacetum cinerariifolium]